jgi:hypothetical protein
MTPITDLSPTELAAINMSRSERGLGPFGNPWQIQAKAAPFWQSVVAQDFAPEPGGERRFEISIRDLGPERPPAPGLSPAEPSRQGPRWTTPSEPPAPPAQPPAPSPGSAFDAGVATERKRQAFADQLRLSIARKLSNRAAGSQDEIAKALHENEEALEFRVEAALPPLRKVELTKEQQAFADALTTKINQVLRPEARAR